MWFYSGLRPATPEKITKYDRLIFDITYNDWNGDEQPFNNHWASIGLNTNLMFDIPLAKENVVSLGIGVAHQLVNIRHDNRFQIDPVAGTTNYTLKDSLFFYDKSTLSGNSFSIPLELRFRSKGWRHFKFHLGGKFGYQANLFSKSRGTINGSKELVKRFGFPDKNDWIYSAHFRIGIRNWALFGSYNFNTIFSNPNSIQLNRVQMGLSISLF
jgi:hypothetical protein